MTVSPTQHLLIRITMAKPAEYKGIFYPDEQAWDPKTGQSVCLRGAGQAQAIKALIRSGLATPVPELSNPYCFQLTPETMAAFRTGAIEEGP